MEKFVHTEGVHIVKHMEYSVYIDGEVCTHMGVHIVKHILYFFNVHMFKQIRVNYMPDYINVDFFSLKSILIF